MQDYDRHYYQMEDKHQQKAHNTNILVIVNNDLKHRQKSTATANQINKILGTANRNITFKTSNSVLKLCNSLVRPLNIAFK